MNSESNQQQLEQVRQEIRAQAARLRERPLLARTIPVSRAAAVAVSIEHSGLDYPIGALTDRHHRRFVENAFRNLLKREPDTAECEAQLALLASGATKAEVLGNLRWSKEGRNAHVHVRGLLPRYLMSKARRVPILGYLLDWGMQLLALPTLARHQRASDTLSAAREEAAQAADHALGERVDEAAGHAALLRQRVDDLHANVHALNASLTQVEVALRGRVETLEDTSRAHGGRLDELAFLRQRVHAMNHWSHHLTEAFARIEAVAEERDAVTNAAAARIALARVADDPARMERQRVWAERFAAALPDGGTVLALGCASDWIAALAARGFDVTVAESNTVLAAAIDAPGINIDPATPKQVLSRSADASIDGLCMLALPMLAQTIGVPVLFEEAARVLRPGGTLLVADGRDAAEVTGSLLGPAVFSIPDGVIEQALAIADFVDVTPIDGAQHGRAWLARRAQP